MTAFDSSTITEQARERFLSYVKIDHETGAWLWTGGITGSGYGAFWFKGRTIQAHRFAWTAFKGSIPAGTCLCHRFENLGRHNVNPDHLFLGTMADNMQDAAAKGRTLAGENSKRAKLTASQAISIFSSDLSCEDLGAAYGVSGVVVSNIRRGKTWISATGAKRAITHNLNNKYGYPGVRWRKGGWEVQLGWSENGKYRSQYLGRFKSPEQAHEKYLQAKAERLAGLDSAAKARTH